MLIRGKKNTPDQHKIIQLLEAIEELNFATESETLGAIDMAEKKKRTLP